MTQPIRAEGLEPGFADPSHDAQRVFRALLDAMSHPGTVMALDTRLAPPAPLAAGTAALCLTLADLDTPLWLDAAMATEGVAGYLRFHCGTRVAASPAMARFALVADGARLPPLDSFDTGDDEYPERSATLFIQVKDLRAGEGRRLTGPGIESTAHLSIDGLAPDFWQAWRRNHALFPRGLDVVFVAGDRIAALPRTTEVDADVNDAGGTEG